MEHAELSYVVLNERVPAVEMNQHAIERELLLLKGIGVPATGVRYELPVSPEDASEAAALLRASGIGEQDRVVAINPMARWPTKLWEPAHFAAVADRLEEQGIRVVFTGGAQDQASIDEICRLMSSKDRRLDGRTNLKTLASIFRRTQVLLTTDSGPMHLAAAAGAKVLALFGPTAPWRTGPYGRPGSTVRTGIECSPCFKRNCENNVRCMEGITVENVMSRIPW